MEHVFYNAQNRFTLQFMVLLAPLKPDDDPATINLKLRVVSQYIDILIAWRIWNFRSISYSTMQYAKFVVMREIRHLDTETLAQYLEKRLREETETFESNDRLYVHQQNRFLLHRLLARITDYLEVRSGQKSRYTEYVGEGTGRYEVEHIWADHYDRHKDEFGHPSDFAEFRNRIGGLLLVPKSFNAIYGDLPYSDKLKHYNAQNHLARSLHPDCYDHNPDFLRFVEQSGLPFKCHMSFVKADLVERGELYRAIAQHIWNPSNLVRAVDRVRAA